MRKRHRSQTGMPRCEDPRVRKLSISRHRRSYYHSRMGGKFSTTRGPCGRRDSIEGDGLGGELCRGTFSNGGTQYKYS